MASNGATIHQGEVALLLGTIKGGFVLRSSASRSQWKTEGPFYLGSKVHHMVLDPRDGKTMLMAARTGHLGPTVFRSTDAGKSWKEAEQPPAFPKAEEGKKGLSVDHVFWLTPGHASEPNVWYAGSSPQGLFRSEDGGATWQGVAGFNEHPDRIKWVGGEQDYTPDGGKMHSVIVSHADANHLYIGMSSGGVFESKDRGATWTPLNKGCAADFIPTPDPEYGHDPHCVQMSPVDANVLYQQNHCGIYRIDRPSNEWVRIGENMPKEVGDVGFPMTLHPRDVDSAWVFPMSALDVWPRVSPNGEAAAYVTRDGGKSWQRQDKGLPQEHGWLTVKRQCMAIDRCESAGLYFGTTGGEVWASLDEGESWQQIAQHLPHIYSVEVAEFAA